MIYGPYKGTKMMGLTDACGLPIAVDTTCAQPHEIKHINQTLDACFLEQVPEKVIGDRRIQARKLISILFVCILFLGIADSANAGRNTGSVVVSTDAPTTDVIVSDGEVRATYTKIFDVDARDNHGRGNTFTTPNDL